MRILGLDTATENCSAALLLGEREWTREELLQRGSAERILPMIQELLTEAGVTLKQLDAVAFGRGPGGFTGVRLAASVTQGLAFGAAVPVVGVSDLRALAQRALDVEASPAQVLVCSDARMQEVYWGCFWRDAGGSAAAVGDERVGKPDTVSLPEGWGDLAVQAAGSGFAAYPDLSGKFGGRLSIIRADLLPRALEIARLARREVAAGRSVPAEGAIPVYLRDDVARPAVKSLN